MDISRLHSALHATKALVLLGFTVLVAPALISVWVPLTGSFLLDMIGWYLACLGVLGAQAWAGVAWTRREGGPIDVHTVDRLAMEALALAGGGFFGALCTGFGWQGLAERPVSGTTLVLGGIGLFGLGAAGWAGGTAVLRASRLLRALR